MAWTSPRTWVTSEVVTAAHMNANIRDNLLAGFPDATTTTSWTPTLEAITTNPGTDTPVGRKWRVGPVQFVWVQFVMNIAEAASGTFFVALPAAATGITSNGASGTVVGSCRGHDASTTANSFSGSVFLASATSVRFGLASGTAVNGSSPFTWATSDVFTFSAMYPVA